MYPLNEITVTTPFGKAGNTWMAGRHTGTDFRAAVGTPVHATKGGRVVEASWGGRYGSAYGLHVVIRSTYAFGTREHLYAHLSSERVSVGEKVSAGDLIGFSGATGHTFGPHLHYEERVSPYNYWSYKAPVFLKSGGPIVRIFRPTVHLSNLKPGKRHPEVKRLQRHLNRHMRGRDLPVTGFYGELTKEKYAQWQTSLGYKGKDANGVPGRRSLEKLNFKVKA